MSSLLSYHGASVADVTDSFPSIPVVFFLILKTPFESNSQVHPPKSVAPTGAIARISSFSLLFIIPCRFVNFTFPTKNNYSS